MKKDVKGKLEEARDSAGILEYIFGTLAFISVAPVVVVYFVVVKLIIHPIIWLKKKVWK